MTTTPAIDAVSSISRIPSTAAWSAAILSPRPIQRPAAIAADSVTRTSSSARLRSGIAPEVPAREPVSAACVTWASYSGVGIDALIDSVAWAKAPSVSKPINGTASQAPYASELIFVKDWKPRGTSFEDPHDREHRSRAGQDSRRSGRHPALDSP